MRWKEDFGLFLAIEDGNARVVVRMESDGAGHKKSGYWMEDFMLALQGRI